jgi:formylglycine-generating enzyme required for sulfatase activity
LNRGLARAVLPFAFAVALSAGAEAADYTRLPGGELRSVLPPVGKWAPAKVAPFDLRTTPVTNGEFRKFLATHAEWRRGSAAAIFADSSYLADWSTDGGFGTLGADQPVTEVSWFAAEAFCESEQARLPRWHEWEFAAAADETRPDARDDPEWRERILAWYARPSGAALPPVGKGPKNHYGLHDMHGLVWEWVEDFAGLMISADNRNQGDPELLKFCGAGALSTQDRENYAVLMRVAMLSSLNAQQSTRNLGFRCARDVKESKP